MSHIGNILSAIEIDAGAIKGISYLAEVTAGEMRLDGENLLSRVQDRDHVCSLQVAIGALVDRLLGNLETVKANLGEN